MKKCQGAVCGCVYNSMKERMNPCKGLKILFDWNPISILNED